MVGGLGMPAKLAEQVSADRGQLRVVPGDRRGGYRFHNLKSGRGRCDRLNSPGLSGTGLSAAVAVIGGLARRV